MFSVISKLNHSRSVKETSSFGQELRTSLVIRRSQGKCSVLHVLLIDSCSLEISDGFMQHHESYTPCLKGATIYLCLMTARLCFCYYKSNAKRMSFCLNYIRTVFLIYGICCQDHCGQAQVIYRTAIPSWMNKTLLLAILCTQMTSSLQGFSKPWQTLELNNSPLEQ